MITKCAVMIAALVVMIAAPLGVAAQDSGLRQTPTGVPWFVSSKASDYRGPEAALRIASSKWRAPWAKEISSGKVRGSYRLVSVNGGTYLAMSKLKAPFSMFGEKRRQAHIKLLHQAVKATGCKATGNVTAKINGSSNGIEKMAIPVACRFS